MASRPANQVGMGGISQLASSVRTATRPVTSVVSNAVTYRSSSARCCGSDGSVTSSGTRGAGRGRVAGRC